MVRWILLLLLGWAANNVWAARPFVTDDARLTTAGSCQLESWVRMYRSSQEVWALPACNPTGNLELTVGGGAAKFDNAAGWTGDYVFQAKTLFKTLESNSWGIGAAVGTVQHPEVNPGANMLGNRYAYVPLSMSFADNLWVVHVNTGWLRDKASHQDLMTWGLGTELNLDNHWTLIAETFGNSADNPYWQAGTRYSLIPGLLQLDATAGEHRKLNGQQWFSFGLRYTPDKLF